MKQLVFLVLTVGFWSMALDPQYPLHQKVMTGWTSQEGLSSDNITQVLQDSQGYFWFGTYNGIVRFDGIHFHTYSRFTNLDFPTNSANVLMEDRNGGIWAGTNGDGVVYLFEDQVESIGQSDGMPSLVVRALAQGSDNQILAGTNAGLVAIENRKVTLLFQDVLGQRNIVGLHRTSEEVLWVSTGERELFRIDGPGYQAIRRVDALSGYQVLAFVDDPSGGLYLGTQNSGLFFYDPDVSSGNMLVHQDEVRAKTINALRFGRNGELWVGTDSGLFSKYSEYWSHFGSKDGLVDDQVSSLFEDTEGNLWLGTSRGGVVKFSQGKFRTVTKEQGLVDDKVNTICFDPEMGHWIGTDNGLSLYQDGEFQSHPLIERIGGGRVRHIQRDSLGRLWVSTYSSHGVLMMEGQSEGQSIKNWNDGNGLSGNRCRMTLTASDGTVWVATTNGLNAIYQDGSVEVFNRNNELREDYILCVFEDDSNRLWIGTNGGGLHYKDPSEPIRHMEPTPGCPSYFIFRIMQDSEGFLWITSNDGISLFKDGAFIHYSAQNGLPGNAIFEMVEDRLGYFWMTADVGIFRAKRTDMLAIENGQPPIVDMELFDSTDGLKAAPTPVSFAGGLGERDIWFPTLKGAAIIDPARIHRNLTPPPVYIEHIYIDGQDVDLKERIELVPGFRRLIIHFTGLSFGVPKNVMFQYRLKGFDSEWSPIDTGRSATYTTLPPGAYSFQVRAMNDDGIWSQNPAVLEIVLPPKFSQTIWFYAVLVLSVAGLVAGIFAVRTWNLKKQRQKLQLMVRESTEEIVRKNEILEKQQLNLKQQQEEIQKANAALTELARTDSLTGLANRRHFQETLERDFRRCIRTRSPISIIMIDVDFFKPFNDYYGHQKGDECLKDVAEALKRSVYRTADMVARYGGEEFIAVLGDADSEAAQQVGKRAKDEIQRLRREHKASAIGSHLTCSFGVATMVPERGQAFEELIKRADEALYQAKANGRNRIEVYDGRRSES